MADEYERRMGQIAMGLKPTHPMKLLFDGDTFEVKKDGKRLTTQLYTVREYMRLVGWQTLAELELATGFPQASISARLRDLRKERFGGWEVERRRRAEGVWEYKAEPPSKQMELKICE